MKIMVIRDRNVLNTKFLGQFANNLVDENHDVHVVCHTFNKVGKGVELDKRIRFTNLNGKTKNIFKNIWRKFKEIFLPPALDYKKIIKKEKPDVIICYFFVDLFNVTFLQKNDIPIVMMMHGYPLRMFGDVNKKGWLKKRLYNAALKRVDCFHVLMNSFKSEVETLYPRAKVAVVPNAIVQIVEPADLNNEKKKLVYLARVEKRIKRQHLAIEAFGMIAKDFPDWCMEFYGLEKYKDYNQELMDLAAKYGIADRVRLMGYAQDVLEVYKSADIQVFPSRSEGFSLALADGMAAGIPAIGFADAHSVNELIIDGYNGFLVNDAEEFALKLKELMENKTLRAEMGKNAVESVKQYAPEIVNQKWYDLLDEITK